MKIYADENGGYVLRGDGGFAIPLESVTGGGIGTAIPVDAGGGPVTISAVMPAQTASEGYQYFAIAPITLAGTVTAVTYVPKGNITGDNTNYRTIAAMHRTGVNGPVTTFAQIDFLTNVDATAGVAMTLPWFGGVENRSVATNEYLYVKSAKAGATGLADPGGLIVITIEPA